MWTAIGIRCTTLWNYVDLFWNYWNYLEILGITWKFLELLGNIWIIIILIFLIFWHREKTHLFKLYYSYLLIKNYLILSSILSRKLDTKSFPCDLTWTLVFDDGKIAEFPKIKKITKIPEIGKCPRGWQLCRLLKRLAFISIFGFIPAGLAQDSFFFLSVYSISRGFVSLVPIFYFLY